MKLQRLGALCGPALLALLASGCTHAQAKTAPDSPPLQMPAPPPREIAPMEAEAPGPVSPQDEPARRPPAARSRPTPPRAEMAKPEPPASEPAKPVDEPAKASPLTTLQTTPAGAEGEMERSIRAALGRASADLGRVDYRVLNTDARNQYNTARRFVQQAEDALRTKNLVFAKNLADKAAALAAQLAGR